MDKNNYYSFVFRGLLTEESLDTAGRKNKAIFPEIARQETIERLGIPLLDTELVEIARKMSIVYSAICAFENSVRIFISKKLLEEKGDNWWEVSVSERIRKRAESRKEEEGNVKWHTPRGDSLINYTEFGDLVSIMQTNFEYFEPHIIDIEWARQIIQSLERSRNVIMHSGELAPTDIERVGMSIRDWVSQVGA